MRTLATEQTLIITAGIVIVSLAAIFHVNENRRHSRGPIAMERIGATLSRLESRLETLEQLAREPRATEGRFPPPVRDATGTLASQTQIAPNAATN